MQDKVNILQKLYTIQGELKAPKGQYNSFGKYNYRSCEDILEALKPYLQEHKLTINLSDNLLQVGNRNYVQAVATLTDIESGESVHTTAFAREDETKKGMDGSQITGSASSYARKYALNGLLAIDDTKDSDYTNTGQQGDPKGSRQTKAKQRQSKKPMTLEEVKNVVVTAGDYAGKTLWQIAEEDIYVIQTWYDNAKGEKREQLKLILDAKEWVKDE